MIVRRIAGVGATIGVARGGVCADERDRGPAMGHRHRATGDDGADGRVNRQGVGATAALETDALTRSSTVAADNRSASAFLPATARGPIADDATQTASFAIGALRLELSAAPGAARLVVASGEDREVYVVEPAALTSWADATGRLLALTAAADAASAAEYRAPFLIDREGRASIAFEGLVTEHGVAYRLLVTGAAARIAGIMTTADLVRGVTDAVVGAVAVARST